MTASVSRATASGVDATSSRRTDIQGLRALAVVLVVGFHVRGWIPGGYIGVDVFFVVSGFVITSMLERQVVRGGSVGIRSFFARRARRLLPMLALTLGVTSLLGVLLLSPLGAASVTAKTGVAAALINANTFLSRQSQDYFALPADANALLHTWSLSVEEQFYLVVPFVVAAVVALRRRGRASGRAVPLALVAVGGLVSFGGFVAASGGGLDALADRLTVASPQALAFYAAPFRAWEFLVGAAAALAVPAARRVPPAARSAAGIVGVVVIIASAVLLSGEQGVTGPVMAVPVLGAAAMLLAGVVPGTPVARVLSVRGVVAVGDLSYGWYLWHWPLIVFVEANSGSTWLVVAAAIGSLGVAQLLKGPVEDRFRHSEAWTGRRAIALAAACIALPVLAGAAALLVDRQLPMEDLAATGERHIDSELCNRRHAEWVSIGDPACRWSADAPRGRIVLIGDSHASMWSEAVIEAGDELGYDVDIATMSGCPMVSGTLQREAGIEDPECQEFIERSVREMAASPPDLVLVGTGSTGVLTTPDGNDWLDAEGRWTDDLDEVAAIWEAGLGRTLSQLGDAGIPVTILHDVPYHEVTTASCGRLLFLLSPSSCASDMSRDDAERQREVGFELEERLAGSPSITTMDPLPWLCDERTCSTYRGGTWMYRDGDHLSVAAAEALAPSLRDELRSRGW